jgi:ribosome-associated protein
LPASGFPKRTNTLKTPVKRAAAKRSAKTEPKSETVKPAAKKAAAKKAPAKTKSAKTAKSAAPGVLDLVLACLEDAKAEGVVSLNLDAKSALADQMVIASGRSNRHVAAIADQLVEKLKSIGHKNIRVEGLPQCDWVLVDSGPVIIHLFRPEVRTFYNLEKLWSANAPDEQTQAG